ncbi:MAG: bifunctional riboflavin kinase/FMN adenylyltransferase, partial [Acidobacteria bacterium]|nr:bifunctional riboflavin kinase/FMN adenylyltransferase [Acidobacteriota bacterium]
MKVAHTPDDLAVADRAVAIGSFDGVHRGHQSII